MALGLVAVASEQAALALDPWLEPSRFPLEAPEAPPLELWPFVPLFLAGASISVWRPLLASRLVTCVVLVGGALAATAGVAVAHDATLPVESSPIMLSPLESVPTTSCGEVITAPVVYVDRKEVILSGALIARSDDSRRAAVRLEERLLDERQRFLDLHEAANDSGPFPGDLDVQVDAAAPMELMASILGAADRAAFRAIHLVSATPSPVQPWTRSTLHQHICSVTIVLADEGRPIGSFTSWIELVRAADGRSEPLRLSVR